MLITKANADTFDKDDWTFLFRLQTSRMFTPDGTENTDVALVEEERYVFSVWTRNEVGYNMKLVDLLAALEEHTDLVA
jgi:hypothetical protein